MKTILCLAAVALWGVVLGGVTIVVGMPPQSGETPDVAKQVFIPRAGYAHTTYAAHLRQRATDRGAMMFAPGQPLSISGTRTVPVICVAFGNVSAPFPTAKYQDILFGKDNPFSLSAYYRDISGGRFSVTGQVVGWYTAPKEDTYYENQNNGNGPPFGELLEFALRKADAEIDFSQFDNDGPDGIPNSGDDDGKVDAVFFIHPERGGECGTSNIWSHSGHYSSKYLGHSKPFETRAIRRKADGTPLLDEKTGMPMHIVIEDYTIQPGLACDSTPTEPHIIQIGVFCHEYGHALGLPDLYDRTPQNNPDSEGVGNWCLMAGGAYGGDGHHAERPVQMSAWCKYYLGWSNLRTLQHNGPQRFPLVASHNEMYRVIVPNSGDLEYFLIEYRNSDALNSGKVNWDEYLRANGLAVWHVDERVGASSERFPFTDLDKGQNDSPVRLNDAPPPLFESAHPLVYLLQADRQQHLDYKVNRGNPEDLFQRQDLTDDPAGIAGTRGYDGNETGIAVTNINVTPTFVTANVSTPGGVPAVAAVAMAPANPPSIDRATATILEAIGSRTPSDSRTDLNVRHFAATLSDEERRTAEIAIPEDVYSVLPPRSAWSVVQVSNFLRTQSISTDSKPQSAIEDAVQTLLQRAEQQSPVTVYYAPGKRQVTQLTGLRLMAKKKTLGEDAQARVAEDSDLSKVFHFDEGIQPITADVNSRLQQFVPTTMVEGKKLPIFDSKVSLHYDAERCLVAVDKERAFVAPIGEDLKWVVKSPETATSVRPDEAVSAAAAALGVSPKLFDQQAQEGIYLVRTPDVKAAAKGRVAYRLLLPRGDHQQPMVIFLDGASKKILEIR
jgi:M6 family metalloprotease-like protein